MNVQPWWKRWPERLEWELAQFEDASMQYTVRDISEDGVVHIDVRHAVNEVEYELEVSFPDLYPYFRPVVRTSARFGFHQEPFGGGLCLAGRGPEHWSTDDSAARLIAEQLPLIIRANASDTADVLRIEEAAPEPIGPNYNVSRPDFVLIDSAWKLGDCSTGTLEVGVWANEFPIRGAVLRVLDDAGRTIAEADRELAAQFQGATMRARWLRTSEPIVAHGPEEFIDELARLDGEALTKGRWQNFAGRRVDLLAVVYTDEIRYLEYGDDWIFLLRIQKPSDRSVRTKRSQPFLIQSLRAGRDDLTARVPLLTPLRGRKVAIVGLGAIGGPIALALARAGIGALSLVDPDIVDPGTSPRWPHGLRAAGNFKADAIAGLIQSNWPYTTVQGARWRLGDIGASWDIGDGPILAKMFDGIDMIVDATANTAVDHALADLARDAGVPFLVASATAGAQGGLVARLTAGRTGCWQCFNAALGEEIPLPPADATATGHIMPIACSDMTFTGAGFDLTPIADEAVRIITSTLCEGHVDGYPAVTWDVETLALRTADGSPCPPTWKAFKLPPRSACNCCGNG